MKNKLFLLCIFPLCLSISCGSEKPKTTTSEIEDVKDEDISYDVRFLANIPNVEITLGTKNTAIGNNILYEKANIKENEKVTKPETDPVRVDYDFDGWCIDKDGNTLYDFATPVTKNLNLYARWKRKNNQDDDAFVEPNIKFKEIIDNSIEDIEISGVLNMKINNNTVGLTTASLKKLNDNKDDVKELLNYKINENVKISSAIYNNNKIIVTLDNEKIININVNDATASYKIANSTYENKAIKYENNTDIAPYNVVLGGSSSMENWTTSTEDMDPVTTINVGIGGTTVEQWNDSLCYRLIYPFNPREVVLYVGINNIINAGKNGKETGEALLSLFDNMHEHLPNTTIFYVLMNLVPDFMKYESDIKEANNMVIGYSNANDYVKCIDAGTPLLKANNKPNRAYFLTDGLHMSLYGYIVWGGIVRKSIIDFEKEYYK